MRDHGAIVEQAVDIAKLTVQWETACGREQRAEMSLSQARLDKGRVLNEARKAYPRSGPKARGWGELLSKWGIDSQRASEYMRLAGYVEEVSPPGGGIPTQAEAGIRVRSNEPSAEKPRAPKAKPEDRPPTDEERDALVARLDAEAEERRQQKLAPLRMEARETAVARVLSVAETSIAAFNELAAANIHTTDCTTSPGDLELVKARLLTLFGIIEDELARIDVRAERAPVPRNQLSLLNGGKKE